MSFERLLHQNMLSIDRLTTGVVVLREAVVDLVEVTKALHRERAAQIRQEVEELDPDGHPKLNNFKIHHLMARLEALEMPARTPEQIEEAGMSPRPPKAQLNGATHA
jgi:hypothetical protein